MVNVLFLINTADSVPPDFSEIDISKQDKIALAGGALDTGGSDTDNHSGSATTNSIAADTAKHYSTSTPYAIVNTHNHPCTLSSVGVVNHLPPYKNFRVIYRSIVGWNGKVPAGAIIFSETVPSGWERVDSSSTYFIRVAATAGGTGGSDTPAGHSVSGTVNNATQSNVDNCAGSGSYATTTHNHSSFSDTTDTHSPDWKYWSAGLAKALADAWLRKDFYCLFDGDPGEHWELVSDQTGRYIKHNGVSPAATTGGTNTTYTHSHSKNITSAAMSAGGTLNTGTTFSTIAAHTHTITVSLDSKAIQPSYVKFYIYKLLSDFGQTTRQSQCVTAGI